MIAIEPSPNGLEEIVSSGFTIACGIITQAEIASLKTALVEAIAQDLETWRGRQYLNAHMVMNLMARGMPFVRLLENRAIHAYLDPLLGDTCILYAYTSSSMPPGGSNYSRRIHVDCPRVIPGYITNVGVTLALDDFTDENGAMALLPRSFTRNDPPDEAEFEQYALPAYPRAAMRSSSTLAPGIAGASTARLDSATP